MRNGCITFYNILFATQLSSSHHKTIHRTTKAFPIAFLAELHQNTKIPNLSSLLHMPDFIQRTSLATPHTRRNSFFPARARGSHILISPQATGRPATPCYFGTHFDTHEQAHAQTSTSRSAFVISSTSQQSLRP
jgi:hypothetical protein